MSPESTASTKSTPARSRRKTEIGAVTSDKMNKTRRVVLERLVPHPKYGKLMRRRTVCHVHDETNESRLGDMVEIMETRPMSKLKRWRLRMRALRPPEGSPFSHDGCTTLPAGRSRNCQSASDPSKLRRVPAIGPEPRASAKQGCPSHDPDANPA